MTNDPYGPPDDRPNLHKQPDPNTSGPSSEPAGLGDPSEQIGWGNPAQPYSTQPYGSQPYSTQPYGSEPYGSEPYGSQPGAVPPYGSQPGGPPPQWGPGPAQQPPYPYTNQPYGAQPPPYGSPPPYAPMYSPYAQPSRSNGLAIGALVTGICGFICCIPGLVAIGLGIAGLKESNRTGVGRGMSIAGISLGGVWIALGIVWLIVSTATH